MASFTADVLLVQFINGLFIAAGIYLVASGLSLVFGVLGVLNFAHGSFYMYGAFFVFTWIGFKLGGFWPALLIAPFAVVIVGVATEVVFLRPIYKADPLYQLLLTYGLVLMFGDVVKLIWGADNQSVARPRGTGGHVPDLRRPVPQLPDVRAAADRHLHHARALPAAQPHADRQRRARRHAGSRDGRRARRQRAPALHRRVRGGRLPRRPRRGGPGADGRALSGHGLRRHHRGLPGRRARRPGQHGRHRARCPDLRRAEVARDPVRSRISNRCSSTSSW